MEGVGHQRWLPAQYPIRFNKKDNKQTSKGKNMHSDSVKMRACWESSCGGYIFRDNKFSEIIYF